MIHITKMIQVVCIFIEKVGNVTFLSYMSILIDFLCYVPQFKDQDD